MGWLWLCPANSVFAARIWDGELLGSHKALSGVGPAQLGGASVALGVGMGVPRGWAGVRQCRAPAPCGFSLHRRLIAS